MNAFTDVDQSWWTTWARGDPLEVVSPLTSTWPHLRCDVGLEEGEHRENCLCLAVLCTIIMVHKDTSVLKGRSTVSGFDLA